MKVAGGCLHHISNLSEKGSDLISSVAFRGHSQGISRGRAKETAAKAVQHIHDRCETGIGLIIIGRD
jgi:hypothetical protein